jgi:hypothetical protein
MLSTKISHDLRNDILIKGLLRRDTSLLNCVPGLQMMRCAVYLGAPKAKLADPITRGSVNPGPLWMSYFTIERSLPVTMSLE